MTSDDNVKKEFFRKLLLRSKEKPVEKPVSKNISTDDDVKKDFFRKLLVRSKEKPVSKIYRLMMMLRENFLENY